MNTTGKLNLESSVPSDVTHMDQGHFPQPWTEAQWKGVNLDHNLLLTWKVEDTLIGFALFGALPGDNTVHLFKILILPSYRGKKEAQAFWSAICQELKSRAFTQVYLEVESSNHRAIKFYENCHFRLLRKAKGYYSSGEDALIMELML